MIKYALALVCAAALSTGLSAQISGSINRNAAKVTNTIEMGGNKLHIAYTAIRFGEGQWKQIKDNKDSHERFNKMAEGRPIGTVETSTDLQVAGKKVAAGKYSLYFTVHAEYGWLLNVKSEDGKVTTWGLRLSETDDKASCMQLTLAPTAKDNTASLTIAFGSMQVTVPVTVAEKE